MNFSMNYLLAFSFIFSCAVVAAQTVCAADSGPRRLSMDFGWRFQLGHAADVDQDFGYGGGDTAVNAKTGDPAGPGNPKFDDSKWQSVDLPHDWAVGIDVDPAAEQYHGYKKIGRRYPQNSVGWYRKTFTLPKGDLGKRIRLEFGGVFRDCQIWLNGHPMFRHESGYTSFGFEITDYLNYGGKNTLVVRADATGYELWSYEGAGIYRHVWMTKTQPLHVARWGTFVASEVNLKTSRPSAQLTIKTKIQNQQHDKANFELVSTIIDPAGKEVAQSKSQETISPWETDEITQKVKLENATLWSLEVPNLYQMITRIEQSGKVVDTCETTFGIRSIAFDPDEGFLLNGESVKLKGVCLHQDHGGVGVAVPDRVQEYRIEKLKELGCNAIRTAHNWVAEEMLDACDRLGMMVMNETRMSGSTPELLNQLETMMTRDRNHPSIILWSLGNEEHVIQHNEVGMRVFGTMSRLAKRLDPSRPTTLASHGGDGGPVNDSVDVLGCNYLKLGDLDVLHQKRSDKAIYVSEASSSLTTRGIFDRDDEKGYHSGYDEDFPGWGQGVETMWQYVAARKWLAGTFIWTGFDYGGEALMKFWPAINSNFGIMDRACFPKPNYHYLQSWWSDKRVLHVIPHWNWPGQEGQEKRIWVDSNCQQVELIVNGQSLGRKEMEPNARAKFKANYLPGVIQVKGYSDGKLVETERVETTGAATSIRCRPDRRNIKADNQDVSLVTVELTDDQGRVVPDANNTMHFSIEGHGKIIGLCNGDPSCHILENQTTYPAFNGLAMVFVQSTFNDGNITLRAESQGLNSTEVIIDAEKCRPKPFVP
jgi:beta-galactosidase